MRRLLLAGCVLATALGIPAARGEDRVPDQILVELAAGASIETIEQRYGVTSLESVPRWSLHVVRVAAGDDVDAVVAAMLADPEIEDAEPHRRFESPEGVQLTIADLGISLSTEDYLAQPATATIQTTAAHARYTGTGITVAVLDTGMGLDHPETAARVRGPGVDYAHGDGTARSQDNGVDDDLDLVVDESSHHGTFVAGLVHLAAPDAEILPVRVLDAEGSGTAFSVVNGLLYAIDRGADVINLSLSMTRDSKFVERAVEDAEDLGIVIVAAAGNRGTGTVEFPAVLGNDVPDSKGDVIEIIAVAAVDGGGARASFSNFGPEIDVSAPGVDLQSTHRGSSFATWSGTSFATPLVAGGVALLLDKYPGLSPAEVRQVVMDTAAPAPAAETGLGAGILDLDALTAVLTHDRETLEVTTGPSGTALAWTAVKDATVYDVARGDVAALSMVNETVDLGPLDCLSESQAGTDTLAAPDPVDPAPGRVFFYLFRDDAGGTYGTDSDGHPRVPGANDCRPDA